MNDPHQIAAEAWLKIQYHYTPDMTSHTGQTGIAIIQAAIEKVTRVYADRESKRDIMSKMTIARVEELESRAAHASEDWMEALAKETVLRWRGKLSDPETFEYLYENILAAIQFAYAKRPCEQESSFNNPDPLDERPNP